MSVSVAEFKQMIAEANRRAETARKRPTKACEHREHNIQVACVRWFASTFPTYEPFFWATPNGGYRSKKTACDMKAEGQKAGVPDLSLMYPAKGYHGLFIEMKKSEVGKKGQLIAKGKPSEHQVKRMEALRKAGYKCELCYSVEEFKNIIKDYLYE